MNRTTIGLLFILAGIIYGSTTIDTVYDHTLGWLVKNDWIPQETVQKAGQPGFGRKPTILFFSLALIIIGLYLLWNRNI